MLSEREISAAVGSTAYGVDGGKLGTVEAFYTDDRTGAPSWVAVSTGLFGTRHSIVPAGEATFSDGALHVPVTADAVSNAPALTGDHLDPADEDALRRHYGVGAGTAAAPTVAGPAPAPPVPAGPRHAAPGDELREAGDAAADGAMTRSEEQIRVGTERVTTTRARLVKYVVTEDVQITVPIRREEIRVEEVPVDAPDAGPGESLVTDDDRGTGLPDEIVLHTERPVVSVEVVPVERVRLRVDVVEGQETVSGQVQREQIAVDQTPTPATPPAGGRAGNAAGPASR